MESLLLDEHRLETLQREAFAYLWEEANPANGLVADKATMAGLGVAGDMAERERYHAPASIAATGFALAAYPIGVERGFVTRAEAIERTLATLRFFWASPQGTESDATGYQGFYYHFLDMTSGKRVWRCELSTIDSTFLLAGMLAAAAYFDQDTKEEQEVRALTDALYRRVDWRWAQNHGATVTHGWTPERGFLRYRWQGYDEALLLYALGLGSPAHALPAESYAAWTATYAWKRIYGHEYVYAGPLFIHQFSHLWIDTRAIQDAFMRERDLDYFENSRRATYVHREYAIRNPLEFEGYGPDVWGLTASDGPGPATRRIRGVERRFYDYRARGAPYGPDDGTLAPWGVFASLPFAPEIVLPAIGYFLHRYPAVADYYCFRCSINPTFKTPPWLSECHFGINLGPIVLMVENYRSGLVWRLMQRCLPLVYGLRRAGFTGGWL
jgi:hypothetical protein